VFKEKRLSVRRFPQQKSWYCGPACAQMFLSLPQFSIPSPQQVAYERIRALDAEPDKWYSDPLGLSKYVSDVLPDKISPDIADIATVSDRFQTALDRINYTISFLEIPCITLTLSGNHWVVVDGIRYDEDPSGKKEITAVCIRDPWSTSPDFSYVTVSEFRQTHFLPNKIGERWKDKYVILTQPINQVLLVANQKDIPLLGGGAGGGPEEVAILNLELQGFENVRPISSGGGAPVLLPISVTGLEGASNYAIVPLDATQTREFQDFIYVAIEQGTNALLEVANLSSALQIYNDREMNQRLQELFPGRQFEIENGYFWKTCFELRSRLVVARRFRIEDEQMFLLPDGTVAETLTDFTKGG
jgi:hypothetical protein